MSANYDVKSCGGVIYLKQDGKLLYLVINETAESLTTWGLVKGHVEGSETETQTAIREIYEEVGLTIRLIPNFREVIKYIIPSTQKKKQVVFFLCESNTTFIRYNGSEILQYKWLEYADAYEALTFTDTKDVLAKANDFLQSQ